VVKQYFRDQDLLGQFLDEAVEVDARRSLSVARLFGVYRDWCSQHGEKPLGVKTLTVELRDRGYESGRGAQGQRVWRGRRLRYRPEPEADLGPGEPDSDGDPEKTTPIGLH
jgi:phage/plasmid-associated DNA primase